ncbi:MAG TPA: thaumatin family protein, partial [Polyangiaceae bacterium]
GGVSNSTAGVATSGKPSTGGVSNSTAGVATSGKPSTGGVSNSTAGVATSGKPSTGGSAGASSAGSGGTSDSCGPQQSRLRVTNHCSEPLWLEHSANISDPQSLRVAPSGCYDFAVPEARLESTRVWAKTGCDVNGSNCQIGQSVAPCPTGGCQPPIESKFEATFADPSSCPTTNASANCLTWYNASQVDGYTLPFRIRPLGVGSDQPGCVQSDCAQLDLAQCPSQADLSEGTYSDYRSVDLRIFAPNNPAKVIGCMSPCKKLNYPAPWGLGLSETSKPAVDFCCPTPPISSDQCSSGPVASSAYVTRMHQMCPSVYGYAYDDAAGLHTCPAQTKFEVVFCP